MTDSTPSTPSVAEIQARLHELACRLKESGSVTPEAREVLAELVDELGEALRSAPVPPEEVARLASTTAQLAEALQHHDRGWLEGARDRFDEALVQAETHAPVAVGLARRLADILASIGI